MPRQSATAELAVLMLTCAAQSAAQKRCSKWWQQAAHPIQHSTEFTFPSSRTIVSCVMPLVCCLCFAFSCAFQFYAAMCFQVGCASHWPM